MTWRWGKGRAASVILLLLTSACSNSDPIQSANVNVQVVANAAPAYTGDYRWVRLQVDQITVRPLDSQADSYLQVPLGLLSAFGPVDARSSAAVTVATAPLRTGSYVVESIRVAALQLELANSAPIAPAGCCQEPPEGEPPTHRGVPCTVGQLVEARAASAIVLPFANPPLLQVNQDGTAEVHVVVDGPAFVDMITSQAYTCGAAEFPTPTPAELAQVLTVN